MNPSAVLLRAALLRCTQKKPNAYAPVEFEICLSLDETPSAVKAENQTLAYATEKYGTDIVDDMLDIWEQAEAGELTYQEASAELEIQHADFLRAAAGAEKQRESTDQRSATRMNPNRQLQSNARGATSKHHVRWITASTVDKR